jgi:hypothetical protein
MLGTPFGPMLNAARLHHRGAWHPWHPRRAPLGPGLHLAVVGMLATQPIGL